jgi:hypothetical protein
MDNVQKHNNCINLPLSQTLECNCFLMVCYYLTFSNMTVRAKHWCMTSLEYGAELLRKLFFFYFYCNECLSLIYGLCKHAFAYASVMHNMLQEITKKTDWGFAIHQPVRPIQAVPTCLKLWPGVLSLKSVHKYSKLLLIRLQLIQMSDNLDWNMKNEECCLRLNTHFTRHVAFRKADESLVCSDKTWVSFFKPALLHSETSSTSESSIGE